MTRRTTAVALGLLCAVVSSGAARASSLHSITILYETDGECVKAGSLRVDRDPEVITSLGHPDWFKGGKIGAPKIRWDVKEVNDKPIDAGLYGWEIQPKRNHFKGASLAVGTTHELDNGGQPVPDYTWTYSVVASGLNACAAKSAELDPQVKFKTGKIVVDPIVITLAVLTIAFAALSLVLAFRLHAVRQRI